MPITIARYQPSQFELYRDVVLANNPIAYWPMDETGSTMQDESGNGRTLEYLNGPASGIAGPFDGASGREFDGSSNYAVGLPYLGSGNIPEYSGEFWVRHLDAGATISTVQGLIKQQALNASPTHYTNFGTSMRTERHTQMDEFAPSGNAFPYAAGKLTFETWHHVIFTKASATNNRYIYFDGFKVTDNSKENDQGAVTMDEFFVGMTWNDVTLSYNNFLHAQLSNISIYDFQLTDADVADRRTAAGF